MKILKFGGKSLANGEPLKKAIEIIEKSHKTEKISVVVSARGNDTDKLILLAKLAKSGEPFREELIEFFNYHKEVSDSLSFDLEYYAIYDTLKAIQAIKICNDAVLDQIVSFGERISTRILAHRLQAKGIPAIGVDARKLLIAERKNGETIVDLKKSLQKTQEFINNFNQNSIPIITGFIAADKEDNTITLGRNGSNYTATLLANFLNASLVENWTNINGFYTADPFLVDGAKPIELLSYKEANELAQFGANIIHPKTIVPLIEKNIPIVIKNSFDPDQIGTTINKDGSGKGIKAVNVIKDCVLVSIEGKGMADKVGIDARIFNELRVNNISVKLISQASSERSIGFIVDAENGHNVKEIIETTFSSEIEKGDISSVVVNNDIAVIAITGRHNYALEKAISGLRKNKIWLHLIANSISGEHISLVIDNSQVKKAVNVVHNHVFGALKTIHVFALGKGNVGSTFINQVLDTKDALSLKRNLGIQVVGVADSKRYVFNTSGIGANWQQELSSSQKQSNIDHILEELKASDLENIVIVDNTANPEIASHYRQFIESGFDVIASNKIANTLPYPIYRDFRKKVREKNRYFLYETNVGAGLPVIDTIKHLVDANENVNAINGVFSGSLSYIFNTFSKSDRSFSDVLISAKEKGFTEPDPREDLQGNDVARKLLILAREIGFEANLEDIQIESLIPEQLQGISTYEEFEKNFPQLDYHYNSVKSSLKDGEVLRYVGSLECSGKMKVELIRVNPNEPLANLKDSDSLIQIYTDSYGEKPIIIQGAGAGAEVTARGVYSDLIRIGNLN